MYIVGAEQSVYGLFRYTAQEVSSSLVINSSYLNEFPRRRNFRPDPLHVFTPSIMSDMSTDSSLQPLMMPTPMPSSASAAAELDRFNEFFASCDTPTRGRLQKALDVIHRAIDLFGVDGVCFSFNGGKDSTVVLHLLRIVIAQREQQLLMEQNEPFKSAPPSSVSSPRQSLTQLAFPNLELEMCVKQQMQRVPVMYFDSHDQFPEVRDFIEQCTSR